MKHLLRFTFAALFMLNASSFFAQDPKAKSDKNLKTQTEPAKKEDKKEEKKGATNKIAVSDQAQPSEKPAAKKSANKDKVSPKK
jgi:hypothetical protein